MISDLLKNDLRSYKAWKSYQKELKGKIDSIEHELKGLKAVRYDSVKGNFNQEAYEQRRLGLIDRKDYYEGEFRRVEMNISYIDKILETLTKEEKKTADILIKGETYEKAGERMYLSKAGVQHRVDSLIKKIPVYTDNVK